MFQSQIYKILSYLNYIINSKTKYKIHSPFVYELITQVFEKSVPVPAYELINKLYLEQCSNSRILETTDFGGSKGRQIYVTKFLRVSEIARNASVSRKNGELLYRLVESFKPGSILELGTAFGFSSLYMAKAAPGAKLFTIEGCAAKVEIARANFARLDASTIQVFTGRFDTQLPVVMEKIPPPDFVFMDGHHQGEPTINYFKYILKHSPEETVIVIDDIHWSPGMEKAWKAIKAIPEVMVTIDLYHFGLVFLRKSLSKQNFIIRY